MEHGRRISHHDRSQGLESYRRQLLDEAKLEPLDGARKPATAARTEPDAGDGRLESRPEAPSAVEPEGKTRGLKRGRGAALKDGAVDLSRLPGGLATASLAGVDERTPVDDPRLQALRQLLECLAIPTPDAAPVTPELAASLRGLGLSLPIDEQGELKLKRLAANAPPDLSSLAAMRAAVLAKPEGGKLSAPELAATCELLLAIGRHCGQAAFTRLLAAGHVPTPLTRDGVESLGLQLKQLDIKLDKLGQAPLHVDRAGSTEAAGISGDDGRALLAALDLKHGEIRWHPWVDRHFDLGDDYDEVFAKTARRVTEETGVEVRPELLKAVAAKESSLDPGATNGRAVGLMQVEPNTARERGVTGNLKQPATNVLAGARELARLREIPEAQGSWTRVLYGYNGGPARLESPARVSVRDYAPRISVGYTYYIATGGLDET